jgi:hypothetical protein
MLPRTIIYSDAGLCAVLVDLRFGAGFEFESVASLPAYSPELR